MVLWVSFMKQLCMSFECHFEYHRRKNEVWYLSTECENLLSRKLGLKVVLALRMYIWTFQKQFSLNLFKAGLEHEILSEI